MSERQALSLTKFSSLQMASLKSDHLCNIHHVPIRLFLENLAEGVSSFASAQHQKHLLLQAAGG